MKIKPFKGVRPRIELADRVASPPYDVLDTDEARQVAEGNIYSFLHIIRPEIDLPPETDPYNEAVYKKGAEKFNRYRKENILIQDDTPCFYIYRPDLSRAGGCVRTDGPKGNVRTIRRPGGIVTKARKALHGLSGRPHHEDAATIAI